MVIFSAGRSPRALQPLLVSASWPCERRRERCSWQPTYPVAYNVEYRDPHGVSSAAPAAPRALSAAVPSGGYAFPDAAQYVSCVVPDAARSRRRHVGGRRSSGRRSRLRLGGRHSQHWRIRGAKTSFVGTARLIAASPKIESTFRREMPARWLMCWSKRRSRALAC